MGESKTPPARAVLGAKYFYVYYSLSGDGAKIGRTRPGAVQNAWFTQGPALDKNAQ
jgi:hypothetical protein